MEYAVGRLVLAQGTRDAIPIVSQIGGRKSKFQTKQREISYGFIIYDSEFVLHIVLLAHGLVLHLHPVLLGLSDCPGHGSDDMRGSQHVSDD
jgi:hypothetical protein